MITVENIEVFNLEGAIRGMRNPMNSWDRSDSGLGCCRSTNYTKFVLCRDCEWHELSTELSHPLCNESMSYFQVGPKDLELMSRLSKAGTEHRKYLRQIFVSMDITAPLYFWKEFDTYKVGTVSNSCSTMHKIAAKEFELDDFSHEHLLGDVGERDVDTPIGVLELVIDALNMWRKAYNDDKLKEQWWQMIQLLPSSYNQRRTITMNYENVLSIIKQRSGHKLDEWNILVDELKKLPCVDSLL